MTVVYSLYSLLRHWHFQSSAFDLGIFDQAIWHYSRFERPINTISGYSHILAEHFHPILVALVPLYWMLPRPEVLLVAQAVLLSLSILPVHAFARDRLGPRLALMMSVAYAVFWGIQKAVAFDFHELAFAPLLIATAILGVERGSDRLFWPAVLGLLLVKEDLCPVVMFFGLLLMLRGQVLKGTVVLAIGGAAFAVILGWVMPALSDTGRYGFASAYGPFGDGPLGIVLGIARRPLQFLHALVSPPVKVGTFLLWVGPFLFLPFFSRIVLLAIPLVVERFLSTSANHWEAHFHYSAPLAPILAMAAIDGMSRLAPHLREESTRRRVGAGVAAVIVLLCAILPGKLPMWRLFSPRYYRFSEAERAGSRALAIIPPEASVVAQHSIVPHLSRRHAIYMLRPGAPDAEYVVASRTLTSWPNKDWEEIERLLVERRSNGYEVAFDEEGWILLEKQNR